MTEIIRRRFERHDTAANWIATNSILGMAEWGVESDTGRVKLGDGVTAWTALTYFAEVVPVAALQYPAAQNLGGHRAVVLLNSQVDYADVTNINHAGLVIGITTGAVTVGAAANVQTSGDLTEPTWNWVPNLPVFIGTNGLLTQTPTINAFLQSIGFAKTATTVFIQLQPPIIQV